MDYVLERQNNKDKTRIVINKFNRSYTCGRGKENEIICLSLLVSRRHCMFYCSTNNDLFVTDLGSSNGIFLNGVPQETFQMVKLRENDIIGIGCAVNNPNDHSLYIYKVCIVESSFVEEEETSILSKTVKNNDLSQRISTSSTKNNLGEKRGHDASDIDTAVACKIQKCTDKNGHSSKILSPEEINSNLFYGNQNPCSSNNNNTISLVETKSNIEVTKSDIEVKIDDDIEIIHTSLTKKVHLQDSENNDVKCLSNSSKSCSNHKNYKDDEKMDICIIDEDDKSNDNSRDRNNDNGSNKDVNIVHIKEETSNIIDEANVLPSISSAQNPNFQHIDNEFKLEVELQITDDEEILVAGNRKITCASSPMKLRKVKNEPKTRFSEVDFVNLSDDEEGVFPYSQLFDIKFESSKEEKVEIKQECANNDDENIEKIGLLNIVDEVDLIDSEDDDNPWLERLSRSQLLIKDEDHDSKDVVLKDEIDLGIWEEDDILNTIMSEVPCTSKVPDSNNITHESSTSVHNKIENAENDKANLLMAKISKMDIDDAGPSSEPILKNDSNIRYKQKINTEQDTEPDKQTVKKDVKRTSMARKTVTSSEKLIPIIEAPNLSVRRNRADRSKNKAPKEYEEKSLLNSSTEEEKTLKLKEKLNNNFYTKERKQRNSNRKDISKSTADCHSLDETSISKKQKKIIAEKRRIRLKEIAQERKKLSPKSNQNVQRRIAKPKAKLTLANRGKFLTEQEPHESLPNKSATLRKSNSKQSKKPLTSKADTLKESIISDIETQKPHEENDISKHTVNNAAISLRQSLNLDNTVDIPVPKDSAHGFKETSAGKKHSSRKGTRKKNEIATDPIANVSELRDKSAERPSALMQKENFSPNRVNSSLKSKKTYKKVTFSEHTEIREYGIDPNNSLRKLVGKDAPIPMNKLTRKSTTTCVEWCPKLEEFLLHIFEWSPIWLEEQRYLKKDPPLVPEYQLQNMKLCYDSYKQYYEIVMPLLLLETWYTMTKDIEMIEKNMQRVTAICSIVENSITRIPIPSTNLFLTTLKLEVLVRREDFNTTSHPIFGDLVFLEYVMNVHGKQNFYKVFAYVTHVHQTIITEFTHYNRDLRSYVKDPYAVITYTLQTRPLQQDIPVNRVQRIRTVVYLRSNMRMVQALQYLPQSPLSNLILNPRIKDYQLPLVSTPPALVTKDNLNRKQLEAVFRVTDAVLKKEPKLCFIQGPPGTGKTKVIVNLVTQILYGDYKNNKALRILVCAPSNAAIDEIVIRLLNIRSTLTQKRFNMVRIGRHESMHPTSKGISVTELARRHLIRITNNKSSLGNASNNVEEISTLKTWIKSLQTELACSQKMTKERMKEVKKTLFDLLIKYELLKCGKTMNEFDSKERAKFQRMAENMILTCADVIACTLSSCYTNQMESVFGGCKETISVCIVDEATQSCEAETLIPLMLGVNTLVLVGDPNQLPATILSQQAKKLGLDQSIFSRIQNIFTLQSNNPIIMLDTQYRMDHAVSYWPNKYFYGGRLKNAAEHNARFPFYPYRVLDHNCVQNNDKFSNTTEAEFVANIIYTMMTFARWENTDTTISVGILSPYNNQRNLVLNKIRERIFSLPDIRKKRIIYEVNTVDSFQGQERDVIIMSCVRSHGIGFLSDRQRLCVALTRAKHSLILCGNFKTFMKDQMWYALITDARFRGVYNQVNAYDTPNIIKQFIVK